MVPPPPRTQVFLLTGDAGSGKTLFVASLAHDLAMSYSQQQHRGGRKGVAAAGAGGAEEGPQDESATAGAAAGKGRFLPVMFDAREAEGEGGIPLDALVQHYLTVQLG